MNIENITYIENITFGVEIETTVPSIAGVNVGAYHNGNRITHALIGNVGVLVPQFNGQPWKAERDGSINVRTTGHVACEWVSPILKGSAGVAHLVEFLTFLRSIGATCNSSCGLHVHVGLNGVKPTSAEQAIFVKILGRLVSRNAKALYAQTGTISRETGMYCAAPNEQFRAAVTKAGRAKNVQVAAQQGLTRYSLLNLTNIPTRGTVEFRCFAGTVDTDRVLLHLLSVFSLVITAATRKSITAWKPAGDVDARKAVNNLLKVRPVFTMTGCPIFADRKRAILNSAEAAVTQYVTEASRRAGAR